MKSSPVVEMQGLGKRFGGTTALDMVDFTLGRGEVLALFGENGAGKSTLARILCGATAPDRGRILFDGKPIELHNARQGLHYGVTLVPQELAGCNKLSVAENILVGHLPSRYGFTGKRRILEHARDLCDELQVFLPLDVPLESLTLAERQLVEILKGLSRKTRVLVFDEPTAALTASEAEQVLGYIRRLTSLGPSAVIVTHRISEGLDIADRAMVLRNGRVAYDGPSNVDPQLIVRHMLGSDNGVKPPSVQDATRSVGPMAVEICDWRTTGPSPLRGLDLKIRTGEVVAVYGQRGSGIESLASGLAGNLGRLKGSMRFGEGEAYFPPFRSPRRRQRRGLSYVPSDRRKAGLVLDLSIRDNLLFPVVVPQTRSFGFRRRALESRYCQGLIEDFDIRCSSVDQLVRELSGGNQQKVLIASRRLETANAVVLHEPTRGIDIGARETIFQYIRSLPAKGTAVLIISSDLDEVVAVADRAVVLRGGTVAAEFVASGIHHEAILTQASGND